MYYKILFSIAALWNIAAAVMLIVNPEFMLGRLGIGDPAARLLARSFASSVGTWGIGYAMIAYDRVRFRDFAWLGVLSKSMFFTIYAVYFVWGMIGGAAFVPALADLIFALLFAEFLVRSRKETRG